MGLRQVGNLVAVLSTRNIVRLRCLRGCRGCRRENYREKQDGEGESQRGCHRCERSGRPEGLLSAVLLERALYRQLTRRIIFAVS